MFQKSNSGSRSLKESRSNFLSSRQVSRSRRHGAGGGGGWNSRELDRKSSRGMIYENEELRLRTININAEVERGQSDIRKLRRENEQLKREIWSLRDEYDRINKKVCANKNCSSCEHISNSDSQSEDSDYCETCRGSETCESGCKTRSSDCQQNQQTDECQDKDTATHSSSTPPTVPGALHVAGCVPSKEIAENYENAQKTLCQTTSQPVATAVSSSTSSAAQCPAVTISFPTSPTSTLLTKHNCKVPPSIDSVSNKLRENLHVNFGQLSVLSEENLTNSDCASSVNGDHDPNMTQSNKPCDPNVSPLHEIQSIFPPLSHFENIPYEPKNAASPPLATLDGSQHHQMIDASCPTGERGFKLVQDHTLDRSTDEPASTRIPTEDSEIPAFHTPKHFFSPINPRLTKPATATPIAAPSTFCAPQPAMATPAAMFVNPPDLFVANALASPCHRPNVIATNQNIDNLYATQPSRVVPVQYSSDSSFYDGNLEDLLLEIETLQIQLEKHKSFSQEKLAGNDPFATTRKPYRSEMNLVVSCNGCKPSITPISKQTSASLATGFDYVSDYFANNSLAMDTPPPNVPQPMILFPQNLAYMTRENYGHGGAGGSGGSVPVLTDATEHPSRIPTPVPRQNTPYVANVPIKDAGIGFENFVAKMATPTVGPQSTWPESNSLQRTESLRRNNSIKDSQGASSPSKKSADGKKSPASMRRKLFSSQREDSKSASLSESSNKTERILDQSDGTAGDSFQNDSSTGSDTIKRKTARRISIAFSDTKKHDEEKNETFSERKTEENTFTNKITTSQIGTSLTNDLQKSHRAPCDLITQSTPSSPHFGGRHNSTAGHSHHHHHHHHHDKHCSRKSSQDSTKIARKCSRRYSEGTVDLLPHNSFNSGYGTGSNYGGEGRRQGNFQEAGGGGTSISERNSNSFASSRESSTTQSTHSQRRKISVSSHNGGKIPWCGCWGNGCL